MSPRAWTLAAFVSSAVLAGFFAYDVATRGVTYAVIALVTNLAAGAGIYAVACALLGLVKRRRR